MLIVEKWIQSFFTDGKVPYANPVAMALPYSNCSQPFMGHEVSGGSRSYFLNNSVYVLS